MKKIFIVDDDVDFCSEVKDLLEHYNFQVSVAYEGWIALNQVRKKHVDLVLFDIKLQLLSGFYFINLLKTNEKLKDIPVFVVSAIGDKENITRAYALGVSEYFQKPIDVEKLVSKIEQYLL